MANSLLFFLLALFLGTSYAFTKTGLEGCDPFSFVLVRLLLGVIVLVAWMAARGEPLPHDPVVLAQLGALGLATVSGAFLLQTWGQQYVASSYAAILVASGPVFSSVGASLYLPDERLDLRRAAGVGAGFAGVAILFAGAPDADERADSVEAAVVGALAIVLGAILVAAVAVVVRRRLSGLTAAQIALPQLLVGTAAASILVVVVGATQAEGLRFDPWTPAVLAAILSLGVLNAGFGNIVYYRLIKAWGATRTALVGYVSPFIAAAIGVAVLDERLGPPFFVGLALIVASLTATTPITARKEQAG